MESEMASLPTLQQRIPRESLVLRFCWFNETSHHLEIFTTHHSDKDSLLLVNIGDSIRLQIVLQAHLNIGSTLLSALLSNSSILPKVGSVILIPHSSPVYVASLGRKWQQSLTKLKQR
jgi:hypothetical protein